MRPMEVTTQTLMTVYSLSLSQTTVSTAGNNEASRSKRKRMWEPYAVDGEWWDSDRQKVAINKWSLSSAEALSVVLSLGMSMREEKALSGVRLQASISRSLESESSAIWSLELEPTWEGLHFVRGSRQFSSAQGSSSIAPSWLSTANPFPCVLLSLLCSAANAAPSSPLPFPKPQAWQRRAIYWTASSSST